MQDIENGKTLCEADFRQFTGSENWYRHALFAKYRYTDGARYVAKQGDAYWLLDKIFACQSCVKALEGEGFTVWELTLDKEGNGAQLVCTDGNGNKLYGEKILYTDFPLNRIELYFQNGTLFLPSEY